MIGWSSYLMSRVMVTNSFNVHYYERYVNSAYFSYPVVVLQRTKRMGFLNSTAGSMSKFWLTRALKKGCSWLPTTWSSDVQKGKVD
jgi:hypothetical protein